MLLFPITDPSFAQWNSKNSLKNGVDPFIALLELRNTPLYSNTNSPSQLLNQRSLKSILPVTDFHLKPITNKSKQFKNVLKEKQKKQKYYYDKQVRVVPNIENNKTIFVKSGDMNVPGKIVKHNSRPRSYNIKMYDTNREIVRNRKHIIDRGTNIKLPTKIDFQRIYLDDEDDCTSTDNVISNEARRISNTYRTRYGRAIHKPVRYE